MHILIVEAWLKQLIKALPKDSEGHVVAHVIVMDNARYHKNGELQRIAQAHRCILLYLPPYSPDLNPIEPCWAVLKNQLKQALAQGEELMPSICAAFNNI